MEPLKKRILRVDESHDTCYTLSSLLGAFLDVDVFSC
jgi:hypothetical protein